jgi:dTDP-4-dehydrorhamnose reductase
LNRTAVDICDAAAVSDAMLDHRPTSVVNAAAYTSVDMAESEADLAFYVNRDGARIIAEAAAAARIPLIHLSTDYVFDGRKRVPYTEWDRTAPLGIYGRSKDAGERAVRACAPKHVILRTSWVYSPFGNNFVRTMLRLGAERAELRVVDDQTGCPTAAADIASAILTIAREANSKGFNDWGTYHYAGADAVTWYDFAQLIFEEAEKFGVKAPKLSKTSSAEFGAAATRPAYSVLNSDRLGCIFDIRPKHLRVSLADCLKSIFANKDTNYCA